jgi:hypothetical protein
MNIYVDDHVTHSSRIILSVTPDNASYRVRSIMDVGQVVMYYSLPSHVELPVGCFIVYDGIRYTLRQPEAFTMKHSRAYEYTVTFVAPEYGATIWIIANQIDHRLKFDYTATPREHLQLFVDNMNQRDSGWTIGECIEDMEKLVQYNYTYCFDALKTIADTYHTEFIIDNKQVSLVMAERHKSDPLVLCYGKGKGFKSGVGRGNEDTIPPVDRLMVQGGERNIDYDTYGTLIPNPTEGEKYILVHSRNLLLPRSVRYGYDGEHFDDEAGFNADNARWYETDQYGYYVDRVNSERATNSELAYDATAHYPRRIGTVTGVTVQPGQESTYYDITDTTIPDNLDYKDYIIADETLTVVFQSGMLAGREFEADYKHDTRTFELVSQTFDGMEMPNEDGFLPAVGDKYIIVGCSLPDAYIRDDETKTGAEWDMLRAAIRYRFPREDYLYTFRGDIDDIWAHSNWGKIGARFGLGEYTRFRDIRIGADILLRMVTIKDYLHRPWKMELTLSNAPMRTDFADEIRAIEAQASAVTRRGRLLPASPQRIQTRFRFIAGPEDYTEVVPDIGFYYGETETHETTYNIHVDGGFIQHRVKKVDASAMDLVSGSSTSEVDDVFPVAAADIRITARAADTLYLYARVSDSETGSYEVVSQKQSYSNDGWIWLYMGEITPYSQGKRTFIRRWRWSYVKDNTVTLTMHLNGEDVDVSDLLTVMDGSIADNSVAIQGHTNRLGTIVSKVNQLVERGNDLTALLTDTLPAALAAFNTAQGADAPHIDFSTCIDDGSVIGTAGGSGGHCKVFNPISDIN